MTDPVEKEFQNLVWKQPSGDFDQRMQALFSAQHDANAQQNEKGFPALKGGHSLRRRNSIAAWLLSCAASLLLGAVLGGVFFANYFQSNLEEFRSGQASGSAKPGYVDWGLLEKAGLVNVSNEKIDPAKTQILQQSVWRAGDGAFRETYLTVTKRKVLVVDQQERRVFQMELNIPKTVVKEDPGI